MELNKKWFINLSQVHIPTEVQSLIQLGEGFCLPVDNAERSCMEFVKHIEDNIMRLKISNDCELRNKLFPLLAGIKNVKANKGEFESTILSCMKMTKLFMKNNPDILFTRADKGNKWLRLINMTTPTK